MFTFCLEVGIESRELIEMLSKGPKQTYSQNSCTFLCSWKWCYKLICLIRLVDFCHDPKNFIVLPLPKLLMWGFVEVL